MLGGAWCATAQTYPARPITMIVPFAAGGRHDRPHPGAAHAGSARSTGDRRERGRGQRDDRRRPRRARGTRWLDAQHGRLQTRTSSAARSTRFPTTCCGISSPWPCCRGVAAGSSSQGRRCRRKISGVASLGLKANPDKAAAGNPGAGSSVQLSAVLFQNMTGTRFQHVPYRGSARRCWIWSPDRST